MPPRSKSAGRLRADGSRPGSPTRRSLTCSWFGQVRTPAQDPRLRAREEHEWANRAQIGMKLSLRASITGESSWTASKAAKTRCCPTSRAQGTFGCLNRAHIRGSAWGSMARPRPVTRPRANTRSTATISAARWPPINWSQLNLTNMATEITLGLQAACVSAGGSRRRADPRDHQPYQCAIIAGKRWKSRACPRHARGNGISAD